MENNRESLPVPSENQGLQKEKQRAWFIKAQEGLEKIRKTIDELPLDLRKNFLRPADYDYAIEQVKNKITPERFSEKDEAEFISLLKSVINYSTEKCKDNEAPTELKNFFEEIKLFLKSVGINTCATAQHEKIYYDPGIHQPLPPETKSPTWWKASEDPCYVDKPYQWGFITTEDENFPFTKGKVFQKAYFVPYFKREE